MKDAQGMERDIMKKVTIAFDIDGTLRNNKDDSINPNERIRTLLVILSTFKNVEVHIWSGGGELYAIQCAKQLGIAHLCKHYHSKMTLWRPDIAIDDIQDCAMGTFNLIVREK